MRAGAPHATTTSAPRGVPTVWTRRLQWLVAGFSVLAVSGTALVLGYVTPETLLARTVMAPGEVDGFLTWFRLVGVTFLAANAVGLLALSGRAWVFYLVLVTNVIQGIGFFYVDHETMGLRDLGAVGSAVTDGGGGIVALILLAALIRFRSAWAYRRG